MQILAYLSTILMGISLGLMGGGGSILTVPILVYLFNVTPVYATAYSLFIVGLTSFFGFLSYLKKSEVSFKTGIFFGLPAFFGVLTSRSVIVPSLPETILSIGSVLLTKSLLIMLCFAVLMIVASVSMMRGRKETKSEVAKTAVLTLALQGVLVGLITGFVGAGGGFLIIPALTLLAGLPMKVAVGTSLMIIAFNSFFGFIIGDVISGHIKADWFFILTLAALAVIGIYLGSYLSKFVSDAKLKFYFGVFVLIMGSSILVQQISTM